MFKTILFPTDGSEQANKALEYAIYIAKSYGAIIQALFVIDIRNLEGPFYQDIVASMGMTPYADYHGKIKTIMEEKGEVILSEVAKTCVKAHVTCKVRMVTGLVSQTISEEAGLVDLIIMGRFGEHAMFNSVLLGSTTESLIRRTNKPVIVVADNLPKSIGNILTAYDGSKNANSALAVSANFVKESNAKLSLIVVGEKKESNNNIMFKAKEYLNAYDIEFEEIIKQESIASESIIDEAKNKNCDLIVMGAYGHTKLHDLILTSTAQHVLYEAPCPVLLTK